MPAPIEALLRYQIRHGDGYAQDFAIDTEASVTPWSGNDAVATRSLAPFATKADGSVFALWVVGASDLNNVPVVLLDSEGRSSTILASSLREFLGLLALGASLPEVDPPTLEDAPDLEGFRRWLRTDLATGVPAGGASIIARARAGNPGLQRWLNGHPPLIRVPPASRAAAPASAPRPIPGSRPAVPSPRPAPLITPRPARPPRQP